MKNLKLFYLSLLSSLGVFVYVYLVAWFISNAEVMVGKIEGQVGVVLLLLLFVFSALTTSLLVLGKPVLLYFENRKRDAVKLLLCTAGWIFLMFAVLFIIMFLNK